MVDFNQLLAGKVADTELPKPLPVGTYKAVIKNYETMESSAKKTPGVQFNLTAVEPLEDVDQAEFSAYGPEKLGKAKLKEVFYLTEDAMPRLRGFLEKTLRIDCTTQTYVEALAQTTGIEVLVSIKHTISKDGQSVYHEIGSVASAA